MGRDAGLASLNDFTVREKVYAKKMMLFESLKKLLREILGLLHIEDAVHSLLRMFLGETPAIAEGTSVDPEPLLPTTALESNRMVTTVMLDSSAQSTHSRSTEERNPSQLPNGADAVSIAIECSLKEALRVTKATLCNSTPSGSTFKNSVIDRDVAGLGGSTTGKDAAFGAWSTLQLEDFSETAETATVRKPTFETGETTTGKNTAPKTGETTTGQNTAPETGETTAEQNTTSETAEKTAEQNTTSETAEKTAEQNTTSETVEKTTEQNTTSETVEKTTEQNTTFETVEKTTEQNTTSETVEKTRREERNTSKTTGRIDDSEQIPTECPRTISEDEDMCPLYRLCPQLAPGAKNKMYPSPPLQTRGVVGRVMFNSPLWSEKDFDVRVTKDKVCLEFVQVDSTMIQGYVRVLNTAYEKDVMVFYTVEKPSWKITSTSKAEWVESVNDGAMDRFSFSVAALQSSGKVSFLITYNGKFTDNNNGQKYSVIYE